ncbi:RusA family crossover junction endodeoxyribonuclease [uncultured Jatrophihabitans sp.]|uniref:RusA family crossover junction endodeoxyribonuclease n=1 Tax=uncultured Jatrophihabitans sp. TaxID=1610747 RepID=UPI0035CBA668
MTAQPTMLEPTIDDVPELRVRVLGDPVPQGSMRAFVIRGHANVVPDNGPALKRWRADVTAAATLAMRANTWVTLDVACRVDLWFLLPRPKSAPRSRTHPDRKPDLDKLQRACLDALTTARVYTDDARAVTITAGKRYATTDEQPGALIIIRPTS